MTLTHLRVYSQHRLPYRHTMNHRLANGRLLKDSILTAHLRRRAQWLNGPAKPRVFRKAEAKTQTNPVHRLRQRTAHLHHPSSRMSVTLRQVYLARQPDLTHLMDIIIHIMCLLSTLIRPTLHHLPHLSQPRRNKLPHRLIRRPRHQWPILGIVLQSHQDPIRKVRVNRLRLHRIHLTTRHCHPRPPLMGMGVTPEFGLSHNTLGMQRSPMSEFRRKRKTTPRESISLLLSFGLSAVLAIPPSILSTFRPFCCLTSPFVCSHVYLLSAR
jgi:hypothetical protein